MPASYLTIGFMYTEVLRSLPEEAL